MGLQITKTPNCSEASYGLAVVGAGPKGIAIHAKASVLRKRGLDVPRVILIERHQVAAHWLGGFGFTDGNQALCSAPEKDIGFPYKSRFGSEVDCLMHELSWQAFLIAEGAFAKWIDHKRPHPNHAEWGRYLQWVASKTAVDIAQGRVISVQPSGDQWRIVCESGKNCAPLSLTANGLVITGPGQSLRLPTQDTDPDIYDGTTFWHEEHLEQFRRMRDGKVAVVGAGETAATILSALIFILRPSVEINLIYPGQIIFTRAEGSDENRCFSDPTHWASLSWSWKERLDFIKRTDQGVFSAAAKEEISRHSDKVKKIQGSVKAAKRNADKLEVLLNGVRGAETLSYQKVIVAVGFDILSWLSWLPKDILDLPGGRRRKVAAICKRIGEDLSLEGLHPKLHLPMLAGPRQCPGFPKLNCLGLVSDSILSSYVQGVPRSA